MKMREKILWLCLILSTLNAYSIEVEVAGELNKIITDKSVTELAVILEKLLFETGLTKITALKNF